MSKNDKTGSGIHDEPERRVDPYTGELSDEYVDWRRQVTGEGWFLKLCDMVEPCGYWIGAEDELLGALREGAEAAGAVSTAYPGSLAELKLWLERLPREDLFHEVHLEIVDYRERPKVPMASDLDLRGWSMVNPLLLIGGGGRGVI